MIQNSIAPQEIRNYSQTDEVSSPVAATHTNEQDKQSIPPIDVERRRILSQQEGLSALNRFLQRKADF